jgi:hypothetical protein
VEVVGVPEHEHGEVQSRPLSVYYRILRGTYVALYILFIALTKLTETIARMDGKSNDLVQHFIEDTVLQLMI